MIQSVSSIEREFLIKTVADSEQPIRFHGVSTIGTGVITTVDKSLLNVCIIESFDDAQFSAFERVVGYFDCHGRTYAFESTVREAERRRMQIDPPVRLLKSLQRKYVRVRKPRNVQAHFRLANEEITLNYPVCPEYISVETTSREPTFTGMDLPAMIAAFKKQLAEKCSNCSIVMFRTRQPESFEEELISKTGKVLFIPSTTSGLPKNDPYPGGRIITQRVEESFEDPNYFIDGSRFEALLKRKRESGVSSEIWCPIVYYQYVVGYVSVLGIGDHSFDASMIDFLWDFSRILAAQLKSSGYFASQEKRGSPRTHQAEILDISPGGMLISLAQGETQTPICEGSIFSIELSPGAGRIACSARVARRYEAKKTTSYGLVFTDLSSSDLMTLYEFLYRRPFAETDPLTHERRAQST